MLQIGLEFIRFALALMIVFSYMIPEQLKIIFISSQNKKLNAFICQL